MKPGRRLSFSLIICVYNIFDWILTEFFSDCRKLFKDAGGRAGVLSTSTNSDPDGADDDDDDDIALMRRQFANRSSNMSNAAASQAGICPPAPTTLPSPPQSSVDASTSSSACPSAPPQAHHTVPASYDALPARVTPSAPSPSHNASTLPKAPAVATTPPSPHCHTPRPSHKKAREVVFESPLTGEDSDQEPEPPVRRPPRKPQSGSSNSKVASATSNSKSVASISKAVVVAAGLPAKKGRKKR